MSQRPQVLTDEELARALQALPYWRVADGKLFREFVFRDFVEAFGFMTSAALVSEREDHHPEWFNVYKTVRIWLITHVSGGITERDIRLAAALDDVSRGVR